MKEDFPFIIIPKVSIRPDRLVFYSEFARRSKLSDTWQETNVTQKKELVPGSQSEKTKQPICNKHNFELSKKAKARIRDKVTWLYHLAKNKTVTTSTGKVLYSFKMNFVTLTLPSVQNHTTNEINEKCLNQFFTEISQRFNVKNYVWRLEFQKNGNVHYHIATDEYLEYWQVRTIWNRCINKLGYVDAYASSNRGQTFQEYLKKNPITEKNTFEKLKERFTYGCASRWESPNTVDVRVVTGSKNIAFYISKYITKKESEPLNQKVLDREDMSSNLRLWFCSRSLSKVDKIVQPIEALCDLAVDCLNKIKDYKKSLHDYCEIFYFNAKEQSNEFKKSFRALLFNYSQSVGYYSSKKSYSTSPLPT